MSSITRKKNNTTRPPPLLVYPGGIYPHLVRHEMRGRPPSNNNIKNKDVSSNKKNEILRLLGNNNANNVSSSATNENAVAPNFLARLRAALLANPANVASKNAAINPNNILAFHRRRAGPVAVLLPEAPPPPPRPALVRSPSMVFGGTTSLEEILPRIQAYIDRFFIASPHTLTANELISYYLYTNAGHTRIIPHDRFMSLIPEIPRSELLKLQDVIAGGSYGRTYRSSDPTKVVKAVTYEFDPYSDDLVTDYFVETLIQFIIQTDETYGSAVPAIHNIYKQEANSMLYIVMDRFDETLDSRLIADGLAHGKARFTLFKDLMIQLMHILIHLNTTYGFVHRDLKGNNIMLKGDDIKLIDFGFSVMNFMNAEGETFRLAASNMFPIKSPCRFRQDVGQLFVYLNEYRDRLDQKSVIFLTHILPAALRAKGYRQMYNTRGEIMSCPTTTVLDPTKALERLEALNGGRRRRTMRRRRRN